MFRRFKYLFISGIFTFILWEIGLRICVHSFGFQMNLPTYSFENTHAFWFDLDSTIGTFHQANHHYRQKKSCFDVDYFSNSIGFRDKNRTKNSSQKRVLTIGDSFVEGYGVDTSNRFSNILEKQTALPHLNFSFAGNFSPTQYYLLYKKFASKYDHKAVIVCILPANDFIDDDFELIKQQGSNRYKPFLKGQYPDYQLEYFLSDISFSSAKYEKANLIKKILSNFTHTYHLYFYLKAKFHAESVTNIEHDFFIPNYFSFKQKHIDRLKYCLEQISLLSNSKEVLIVSIPNKQEVIEFNAKKVNPLAMELSKISKTLNFEYLDLLPSFSKLDESALNQKFFECDGHWSPDGHEYVSKLILQNFSFYSNEEQ